MSDELLLSNLIGEIYDCAIDPAHWNETLPLIADFLDTGTAIINIVRPSNEMASIRSLYDYGLPSQAGEIYIEKYANCDPTVRAGALYDADEVFTAREAVGDEIWTASEMYREWNLPYHLTEHLSGIIRKDALRIAALTVLRDKPFADFDRDRLRLLLPHLRRSVSIAQLIDDKKVERDRFQEIIDRLTVAVFLVDEKAIIRHTNASGEAMLTAGYVLRSRNGTLTAIHAKEQTELIAGIKRGYLGPATAPLSTADGSQLIATILPLSDGYRRDSSRSTMAAAAVFVDNPAGKTAWHGEVVAKLFKLTGAELQLLLVLLDGATVQAAADRFGVSILTVRTHLQHIFAKTETSRQAELLRKVANLMPPVNL